jgi:TonB family protein
MPAILIAAVSAVAVLIQAPAAADPGPVSPVYDAVFAPLKRSEAQYKNLGPVGPWYPERAAQAGRRGGAVIDCVVGEGGRLTKCAVILEKPSNEDFGAAARVMARSGHIMAPPDAPVGQIAHIRVLFDPAMPVELEHK